MFAKLVTSFTRTSLYNMQKVPQGSDESVPQLFPVSPSKSVEESFRTRDGNQYKFHSYSSIIDIVY